MPDINYWLSWKRLVDTAAQRCTIDWKQEFGNARPLELEIGCGNGMWLRAYAAGHRDRNVIGNELVAGLVKEIHRRVSRDKQVNIRLLAGDIRVILPMGFSDCSIGRTFVNFPDPWFKKKHMKRRLLNHPFLKMLSRKMLVGGDVVVATDDADYFAYARESFAAAEEFTPLFQGSHLTALEDYPQTKYEKKWRAMGREIYYLHYENNRNAMIDDEEYIHAQQLEYAFSLLGIMIPRDDRAVLDTVDADGGSGDVERGAK